jgi:antiviral helicase SKI2
MKEMDKVQRYHAHVNLLEQMSENKCHGCVKLKEHKLLMKEQKVYKDQLDQLKYQMSDDALQQMPQFQGRVRLLCVFSCPTG